MIKLQKTDCRSKDKLDFLADVKNKSECHYLAPKKSYIVFLQVLKMNTDDAKPVYGLANIEEIEINDETLSKFVDGECKDKEQYGRQLTLFYYDNSRKCSQLDTVCDGKDFEFMLIVNFTFFNFQLYNRNECICYSSNEL